MSIPTRLFPNDPKRDAVFGSDVALDANGTTALVAAHGDGAAYVFEETAGSWQQTQKISGVDAEHVAMNDDGTVALVEPFVYEYDGQNWTRDARLANGSVALDAAGTTAVVGDPFGDVALYAEADGSWSKTATLTAGDSAAEYFGAAVALSGTGTRCVVGDYRYGSDDRGAAYVFEKGSGGWQRRAKLHPGRLAKLDYFGFSLETDRQGDTVLVYAQEYRTPQTSPRAAGAVYAYDGGGGSWTLTGKITAPNRQRWGQFGRDVAISADGTTAIIGEYGRGDKVGVSGAVYVYQFEQGSWTYENRLAPVEPGLDEQLGYSVATDAGGTTALAGAWGYERNTEDWGSALVFDVSVNLPSIVVEDLRPIQVLERTILRDVRGSNRSIDANPPPLVEGRPTSILFDLHGSWNLDELPQGATVDFELELRFSNGRSKTDHIQLTKSQVQSLADGSTDERTYFDDRQRRNLLPVFEADGELRRVTLDVETDVDDDGDPELSGTTEWFTTGVDREYPIEKTAELTVGLVELADPDDGGNFGGPDGRVDADFDTLVDRARTRIRQTYPADPDRITVVGRPDPLVEGVSTTADDHDAGFVADDLVRAHSALTDEFPNLDFDVTIAVVPNDYTEFHGDDCLFGVNLCDEGTADLVRGRYPPAFPAENYEATVVHEMGHNFLPHTKLQYRSTKAYPRELALHFSVGGSTIVQQSHARTETNPTELRNAACSDGSSDGETIRVSDSKRLDSTGFDLTGGSYELAGRRLRSFMSYDYDDFPQWPDAHAYKTMIDEGLKRPKRTACTLRKRGERRIARGVGHLAADDSFSATTFAVDRGRPLTMQSGGAVTIRVLDPTGRTLEKYAYPDELLAWPRTLDPTADSVVKPDTFVFAVPFPMTASAMEVEKDGTTTRVDPIVRSLWDVLGRVPGAELEGGPAGAPSEFDELLTAVEALCDSDEYREAASLLQRDVLESLDELFGKPGGVGTGETSKDDVENLVEETIEHLETVAELSEDGAK